MSKKNYNPLGDFYKFGAMLSNGGINGFMDGMFTHMKEYERQQTNDSAGIKFNEELQLFGVVVGEENKIPFEYPQIEFQHNCYICRLPSEKTHKFDVFDKDCNFLFMADDFDYLKQGFFAVRIGLKTNNDYDYAVYNGGKKLTEAEFKMGGLHSGFEGEYCILLHRYPNAKEYGSKDVVINKEGEIILEAEEIYSSYISIHKNLAFNNKKVFNLLTRELICVEEGYSSSSRLEIKDEVFVKVGDNAVYKINKLTCEFVVFGTLPQPKVEPVYTPPTPKEKVVVLPKQQRNELCRCGSGKKVKNCDCKK